MTIQTQFIFDEDGKKIGAIIPIEDYDIFVKPSKENACLLSNDQKNAIDIAIEQSNKGQTFTQEEVMQNAKQRFPKYFK
ncbi:MAG: hypothetical protein R2753_04805 [Chitinophagales bacterium]